LTRIFGVAGDPKEKKTNAALWKLARELVLTQPKRCSELNQSLMELGALVCAPRQPKCAHCPARKHCFAFRKNRVADFPQLPARSPATERRFKAFIARQEDRFLVRRRPDGVVNARLWEFPNIEVGLNEESDPGSFRVMQDKPVCRVRHSITRYRILLEAYDARVAGDIAGTWKTLPQLHRLPFASAHRKILAVLAHPSRPL
jgi:A/G-specific adenine glycosylase